MLALEPVWEARDHGLALPVSGVTHPWSIMLCKQIADASATGNQMLLYSVDDHVFVMVLFWDGVWFDDLDKYVSSLSMASLIHGQF